jgi:hypothetical protein
VRTRIRLDWRRSKSLGGSDNGNTSCLYLRRAPGRDLFLLLLVWVNIRCTGASSAATNECSTIRTPNALSTDPWLRSRSTRIWRRLSVAANPWLIRCDGEGPMGRETTDALNQASEWLAGTAGESDRALRLLESAPVRTLNGGCFARGEHVDTKTNSHNDR